MLGPFNHPSVTPWTQTNPLLTVSPIWFPSRLRGSPPRPTFHDHHSAVHYSSDVAAYISKELKEGAMLGPFNHPSFTPWTQTNPLLTRPKKDSHLCQVIMDLSWPLPLGVSVNGCTRKESFLGVHKKMHLPSGPSFVLPLRASFVWTLVSPLA